ncbi:hypothetical protein ACFLUN_00555 [Chloroflexota bacterium]
MKKLVCDRCGLELTEKEDIDLALEGKWAWEAASRARGIEPRGVIPCENYVRCGGEIILVNDSRFSRFLQEVRNMLNRRGNS